MVEGAARTRLQDNVATWIVVPAPSTAIDYQKKARKAGLFSLLI